MERSCYEIFIYSVRVRRLKARWRLGGRGGRGDVARAV